MSDDDRATAETDPADLTLDAVGSFTEISREDAAELDRILPAPEPVAPLPAEAEIKAEFAEIPWRQAAWRDEGGPGCRGWHQAAGAGVLGDRATDDPGPTWRGPAAPAGGTRHLHRGRNRGAAGAAARARVEMGAAREEARRVLLESGSWSRSGRQPSARPTRSTRPCILTPIPNSPVPSNIRGLLVKVNGAAAALEYLTTDNGAVTADYLHRKPASPTLRCSCVRLATIRSLAPRDCMRSRWPSDSVTADSPKTWAKGMATCLPTKVATISRGTTALVPLIHS